MKAFNRLPFYEQSQKVAHDSKGLIWSLVIGYLSLVICPWSFVLGHLGFGRVIRFLSVAEETRIIRFDKPRSAKIFLTPSALFWKLLSSGSTTICPEGIPNEVSKVRISVLSLIGASLSPFFCTT